MQQASLYDHFKFRDLKVFASTAWLANDEKEYRLVFDEVECTYIYCEFSFFNKLFDESDWNIPIRLKCYGPDNKVLCDIKADRVVSKEHNIEYVREGWGVKTPGIYWKRGSYRWEAWVGEQMIGSKTFYIEKEGLITEGHNPYFDITSIRLYEAPDANIPEEHRQYVRLFHDAETRYIWVELTATNHIKDYNFWACELFFNFRTHNGHLKGSISKLLFIYSTEEEIKCSIGWGADTKGSWSKDDYTLEVVFMDQMIASLPFEVGNQFEYDNQSRFVPKQLQASVAPAPHENMELDTTLAKLDELIGLNSIKEKIREFSRYLNFLQLRKKMGFQDVDKINLHAVFKGNPGTGKTTVARLLGNIYHSLGLLSKGHVVEVDRADLVGEYIGQTAPKVKEAITRAKGGILFIDEAYSLARKSDDNKDFGREVIEILIKELSDGEGDIAVIVAGYPEEMNVFLESNPGIKSRFNMYYDFPDYLPQELEKIALFAAEKKGISFSDEAMTLLKKKLTDAYRQRDNTFGNARMVHSLVDECKMNLGLRIMHQQNNSQSTLTREEVSTVQKEDVAKIYERGSRPIADIPVDEDLLQESLDELGSLTGLATVKKEVTDLVQLVRFYRESNRDVKSTFSLHSVFTGNPGTGKTTVARILAQIYRALGILERGHLVEVDRQGLVGAHIGQTAIKTTEILDRAMGGVLFIDEAYALTEGGELDFGKEAVETILKRMEDRRSEIVVIVAGYTENMTRFLESNPGLRSRFDRILHFEDYTGQELTEIARKMFSEKLVQPDEAAWAHLQNYFEELAKHKDRYFGNARSVRNVVEETIKNQHLRLARIEQQERTEQLLGTVMLEDVKEFDPTQLGGSPKKSIGYTR